MWSITTTNAITHNSQIMMEVEKVQSAATSSRSEGRFVDVLNMDPMAK